MVVYELEIYLSSCQTFMTEEFLDLPPILPRRTTIGALDTTNLGICFKLTKTSPRQKSLDMSPKQSFKKLWGERLPKYDWRKDEPPFLRRVSG